MSHRYTTAKITMSANIGGVVVPISQFTGSYELNKIPSCTLLLPVGYTAATLAPSPAYMAVNAINLQVPMSVVINVQYIAGDISAIIPAGTYMIFCGYMTGVGYRRTYNGYQLAVEGTHWLSALTFSSTLSASMHPQNPAHFSFDAALAPVAGRAGGNIHWTPKTLLQENITPGAVQSDLWNNVIRPWFLALAATDRVNKPELSAFGIDPRNDSAQRACVYALSLMGSDKLPMRMQGLQDAGQVSGAIAEDIAVSVLTPTSITNSYGGMANTTFWDKLVGDLAPRFFFSVAPFPTKASVIPFVPGLRTPWTPRDSFSIRARDMVLQDMDAYLPRALRAVGLFGNRETRCGGDLADLHEPTIGAMWAPRNQPDGMILLKAAPHYMSAIYAKAVAGRDVLAVDNGAVRGNAMQPGFGANPRVNQRAAKKDSDSMLRLLAHAMYVNEVLKDRWGDIHCPLRFDICPGSTIKFEGTEGGVTPYGTGPARYASVQRVTFVIDAQSSRASTSFRVMHVRTEAENRSDRTSVAQHPLYNRIWPGDYMLTLGQGCP
jgi:hypothetical protein